ncbi:hypothetical protein AG1IA_04173 [Rhizoctonia solani AG-1 IA]|uniref:MFS_1 domain-containing protein n=1 Tax=Thanatephorus cucumeris (strain AG1-IA) TaxID=983506 RepID=L8WYI0_THACA|nr:hypothetical protein AG1IA_04173 [Rhizoctonia solani AG-1 IA]
MSTMSEKAEFTNKLPYDGRLVDGPGGSDDDKSEPSAQERALEVDPTEGAPWKWRIIAMVFALSLAGMPFNTLFSEATLGPLKSTLVKELHITNARYGTISSATSVVNMFLPIIGGYLVYAALYPIFSIYSPSITRDFYPIEYGMIFCAFTVFAGAIVSAVGAQHNAFGPVLGGRLLMGFGSTVIEIIPQKIYCHWFKGRGLAFVLGLDVSWGKVVVLVAKATAVPMSKVGDEWAWALWVGYQKVIPAVICGVNIMLTFAYIPRNFERYDKVLNGLRLGWRCGGRKVSAQERARSQLRRPSLKAAREIPSFFWFMFCTQVRTGVVGGFNGLSADIIRATRGTTAQIAGYQGSVQQVIPIFLSPFLGVIVYMGRYMPLTDTDGSLNHIVYLDHRFRCIGIFDGQRPIPDGVFLGRARQVRSQEEEGHQYTETERNSSLQCYAICMFRTDTSRLARSNRHGLRALQGCEWSFNNAGSVIIDVAAGAIQDTTPGGGYNGVIAFFIVRDVKALKGMEIFWGSIYGVLDRRLLRGVLSMSEKERVETEKRIDLSAEPGRRAIKAWTYGGCYGDKEIIRGHPQSEYKWVWPKGDRRAMCIRRHVFECKFERRPQLIRASRTGGRIGQRAHIIKAECGASLR